MGKDRPNILYRVGVEIINAITPPYFSRRNYHITSTDPTLSYLPLTGEGFSRNSLINRRPMNRSEFGRAVERLPDFTRDFDSGEGEQFPTPDRCEIYGALPNEDLDFKNIPF